MVRLTAVKIEQMLNVYGNREKVCNLQLKNKLYSIIKLKIVHNMCLIDEAYNILLNQKFYLSNPIYIDTKVTSDGVLAQIKIDTDLLQDVTMSVVSFDGLKHLPCVEKFFNKRLKNSKVKINENVSASGGISIKLTRKQTFLILRDLMDVISKLEIKAEDMAIIAKGNKSLIEVESDYVTKACLKNLSIKEFKYLTTLSRIDFDLNRPVKPIEISESFAMVA